MNPRFLLKCIILSQTGFIAGAAMAEPVGESVNIPSVQDQADVWYDGDKKREIWKSTDERAIIHQKNPSVMSRTANYKKYATKKMQQSIHSSGAKIIESTSAWSRVRLGDQNQARSKSKIANIKYTNVYYASNATKPLIATGEMIVHFNKGYTQQEANEWGQEYGLQKVKKLSAGNAFVYVCDNSDNCLKQANNAYHDSEVKYAYPNWIRSVAKYSSTDRERLEIDDTLFPEQWYLENTGQDGSKVGADINVAEAWWDKRYGSKNEIIAIVDDGLQIMHEDLKENIVPDLSLNLVDGGSDPSPPVYDADGDFILTRNSHGTNAASIAASRGGNGIGISGTAPLAGLVGIRLLDLFTSENTSVALSHKSSQIDIYSNSWGPEDDARLNSIQPIEEETLRSGVQNGRGGKGSIFVFAAGNGGSGDNSNFDAFSNSPYTIAVAASNNQGKQAYYSENGANLWVNAPSGDDINNIMIAEPYVLGSDSDKYSQDFNGTSAAAPQVSGVVALMLEQNSKLGWRDVQHILAETTYKNDPTDGGWVKNGAGLWVSHKYGFGRVNASAAALAALNWELLPPQTTITEKKQHNIAIPDNDSTGITSTLEIEADLSIDFVEVEFYSDHPLWGDLEVSLVSPEGTTSILAENGYGVNSNGEIPYQRDDDAYKNGWRFGVARLLGESSKGTWTLKVKDKAAIDIGNLEKWSVKVYGSILGEESKNTSSAAVSAVTEPTVTANSGSTPAKQLLDKCIAKYPATIGTKAGGTFLCEDGLLCQKTTGGDLVNITSIGVKADNSGDQLSYFTYGKWYKVALSKLDNCN